MPIKPFSDLRKMENGNAYVNGNSRWSRCNPGLRCVTVCHLLRGGVAAIFGPQNAQTASHVQSICDTMEIPHLETRWDWRQRRQSCLVNLYPHPTTLSKVRIQTSRIIASLKRHSPRKICLRGFRSRSTDFLPLVAALSRELSSPNKYRILDRRINDRRGKCSIWTLHPSAFYAASVLKSKERFVILKREIVYMHLYIYIYIYIYIY